MKITNYVDRADWLQGRKGKITGSRLRDIIVKRGTAKKKGYYELIAERIAVTEEDFEGYIPNETPMDRGTRLEKYGVDRFSKETGKKVDTGLVIWSREDHPDIAISPDGVVSDTEAVECKCLSSASHLEAYMMNQIPSEYFEQGIQYFIVNEALLTLNFIFYDPRIVIKDYFVIQMERKYYQKEINEYLEYQILILKEIDEFVNKLTNF